VEVQNALPNVDCPSFDEDARELVLILSGHPFPVGGGSYRRQLSLHFGAEEYEQAMSDSTCHKTVRSLSGVSEPAPQDSESVL
jgi:hypothetical protein